MSRSRWRVVKLGGSLLELGDLGERFRRWLAGEPRADTLIVTGGGAPVDVLRRWDRLHSLSADESHWLAIRLMGVSAGLVARLLPEARVYDDLGPCAQPETDDDAQPRLAILDPWPLLADDPWLSRPDVLPHSWNVTSDSIAARLAERLAAEELVLLKSSAFETLADTAWRERAAADGYVDAYFPTASQRVKIVRCVQLTDARYGDTSWDGKTS